MVPRSGRSLICLATLTATLALGWANVASANVPASPLAACSPTDDVTTGGGWLLPTSPKKRMFVLQAGVGPTTPPVGRLLFINHIANVRVEGEILLYGENPTNTRTMSWTGNVNGQAATFVLQVTDVAEPGKQQDMFSLVYTTTTGTGSESGALGGGNIQIRPMCAMTSSANLATNSVPTFV